MCSWALGSSPGTEQGYYGEVLAQFWHSQAQEDYDQLVWGKTFLFQGSRGESSAQPQFKILL